MRYTKEMLEPLVKSSTSVLQVMRKLGIRGGGVHGYITKRIKFFNLDTSHFTGKAWNRNGFNPTPKREWKDVLILNNTGRREAAYRLRRALIESGRPYRCEKCGVGEIGDDMPLTLQVNHKSGNWEDNRPENLQFLCPNCHSQTAGFNGSQGLSDLTSDYRYQRARRQRKKQQEIRI